MSRWWIFVMIVSKISSAIGFDPLWSYDDETKWPGRRCQGGGKRQSPIDIKLSDVTKDYHNDFIKYGPLRFTGYQAVLVTGINNGHTVQFSIEGDMSMYPTLTGGPLMYNYRLEQVHFHWLSEHSINGIKYPMEIHFVHVRTDLSVHDALKKSDGLAIVAVFCSVQAELDESQQEVTEQMMDHIPSLVEAGDRISGIVLNLAKLLSPNDDYYTYAGSLTSPNCNEAVIWILFKTPLFLSDEQYRIFGKINVGRHNFRSLQRIKHHQIFTPPIVNFKKPAIIVFFEGIYTSVSDFFTNITSFITKGVRRVIR